MKKLIPFDFNLYKAGAKVVFRNLSIEYKIGDIQYYPQSKSKYKLVAILFDEDGCLHPESYTEKGLYLSEYNDVNIKDLMLEVEDEQPKEQWVNLYIADGTNYIVTRGKTCYISQDHAIDAQNTALDADEELICIGQFKVTQ